MRRAYTLVEMSLSVIIMSIVTIGILYALRDSKSNYDRAIEKAFVNNFEYALKNSFESIVNILEPICGNIATDNQGEWGWAHASCQNSSPYPELYAKNKLVYYIDFASIPAAQGNKLENAIVGSYAPYCKKDQGASNNARLVLDCAHLKALNYDTAGGNVNNPKPADGSSIDQADIPTVNFTYERIYIDGTKEDRDYSFNMADVYQKRREYSLDKFSDIKGAMKDYYEKRMTMEVLNTPPTGLHSVDDEYVPWQWLVFGDGGDPYNYPLCDRAGGDTCQNLNNNNYWRSGTGIDRALIMRRIVTDLLNGENRYSVDGFMNKVMFYPFISQCGGSDLNSCAIDAPDLPQKDYYNRADIPYTSVLYTDNCADLTVAKPEYCRLNIVY